MPPIPPEQQSPRGGCASDQTAGTYLNAQQVRARYGGISDMCLWRWLHDPALGFPQAAMRVNSRRFWRLADLLAWERKRTHKVVPSDGLETDDV